MGFQRRPYKLTWPEGHTFHGLEVSFRGMTIGELEEIATLRAGVKGDLTMLAQFRPVLDIMERAFLGWNYEDEDGTPIPASELRNQDASLLVDILRTWTEVVGSVPTPLPEPSPNGKSLEEVSIPMEIPSSSHPNLNTQN